MMEVIRTCGLDVHIHSDPLNNRLDRDVVNEVIERDTYALRELQKSNPGFSVIVDIGAHIGTFSLLAASLWPNAFVWSFEPTQVYFRCLACNALRNCHPINLGIMGYYGMESAADHEIAKSHPDEPNWRKEIGHSLNAGELISMVPGEAIDLLKIDCEGSEVEILRELESINAFDKITHIRGEWHYQIAKDEVRRILGPRYRLELVDEGDWNSFTAWPK